MPMEISCPPSLRQASRASDTGRRIPRIIETVADIVEVEVDVDSGIVRLDRAAAVDDFGVVINPLLLEGQVHGAIAQGVGQALLEHVVHSADGQSLTGSFIDYAMPRADDFEHLSLGTRNVPTKSNLLGVKGGAVKLELLGNSTGHHCGHCGRPKAIGGGRRGNAGNSLQCVAGNSRIRQS